MAYEKIAFTPESTLQKFFEEFSLLEIKNLVGQTIYNRGVSYVDNIISLKPKSTTKINAEIEGNYDDYKVKIRLREDTVEGKCECVYFKESGICKHLIAVMLSIKENPNKIQSNLVEGYIEAKEVQQLQNMSKQELIDLILSSKTEVQAQASNYIEPIPTDEEALDLFQKIKTNLEDILKDDELLYKPQKFERKVVRQLDKLKPIWDTSHYTKVGRLVLYIINKVDELQDEGYLYTYGDNWEEELYFDGRDLSQYVLSYLQTIPYNKKQAWIEAYNALKLNHGILEDFSVTQIFSKEELPELLELCLEKLQGGEEVETPVEYYQLFKNIFTPEQKEIFLANTYLRHELLTNYYEDLHKDNPDKVIEIMTRYIDTVYSHSIKKEYIKKYLDLLQRHQKTALLQKFFSNLTSQESVLNEENIEMYIAYFPDQIVTLENTLKKNKPTGFFRYLSKHQRIEEALALMNDNTARISDTSINDFYKENKESVPELAEKYFIQKINQNLPHTGDTHYSIIAENLSQLKVINLAKATAIAQQIRTDYKRRTNLIKKMNEIRL